MSLSDWLDQPGVRRRLTILLTVVAALVALVFFVVGSDEPVEWTDADGEPVDPAVLRQEAGDESCGWGAVTYYYVALDEVQGAFAHDPDGLLESHEEAGGTEPDAMMGVEATDTGLRRSDGVELWVESGERDAIYLVSEDTTWRITEGAVFCE